MLSLVKIVSSFLLLFMRKRNLSLASFWKCAFLQKIFQVGSHFFSSVSLEDNSGLLCWDLTEDDSCRSHLWLLTVFCLLKAFKKGKQYTSSPKHSLSYQDSIPITKSLFISTIFHLEWTTKAYFHIILQNITNLKYSREA